MYCVALYCTALHYTALFYTLREAPVVEETHIESKRGVVSHPGRVLPRLRQTLVQSRIRTAE